MKELLYHFTSLESLVSMLNEYTPENPYLTFFATHISFMNDSSEYQYGREICLKFMQKYQKDFIPKSSKVSLSLTDRPIQTKLDNYVISFSSVSDTASMWAMYAKNGSGIALVFNKENLSEIFQDKKLSLSPCLYPVNEDSLSVYLEDIKSAYNLNYEKLRDVDFGEFGDKMRILSAINLTLNPILPIIKHPAFEYEKEERLIFTDEKYPQYRFSNGHLIPYKKVYIPVSAIQEIILGPSVRTELDRVALKLYLQDKGLTNLSDNISISQVPYRG